MVSNSLIPKKALIIILMLISLQKLYGSWDTLRTYVPNSPFVYYQDDNIKSYIARFDLVVPSYLRRISLVLTGEASQQSGQIRILGNEAGLPGPFFSRDIVSPIVFEKKKEGIERLDIYVAEDILLKGNQFFVVVEPKDSSVRLLSDKIIKHTLCEEFNEKFTSQILRTRNGGLLYGQYGFAIDVVVERSIGESKQIFSDVTKEFGISDTTKYPTACAVFDIDKDGFIDLLFGGHLYHNDGGIKFTDITSQSGLYGIPQAQVIADIDNDNDADILFIGRISSDVKGIVLYENDGSGKFSSKNLNLPFVEWPSSFSMSDADQDGFLDIVVGTRQSVDSVSNHLYVFLNDKKNKFIQNKEIVPENNNWVSTVHWIDLNTDGLLDLFVGNRFDSAKIWINSGGKFMQYDMPQMLPMNVVGSEWIDINRDNHFEMIISREINSADYPDVTKNGILANSFQSEKQNDYLLKNIAENIELLHGQAGISTADVNNDGHLDIFRATKSDCRFASLIIQNSDGSFDDETYTYGLSRLAAGQDAIWFDVDNDGDLDLATFVQQQFKLFKNLSDKSGKYVEIDIVSPNLPSKVVGARVVVCSGNRKYAQQVSLGRGICMQGPLRLHYGLLPEDNIDSVIVYWNGDTLHAESFKKVLINRIVTLARGSGADIQKSTLSQLKAFPNPFNTSLTITFTVSKPSRTLIEVYSLVGDRISKILDNEIDAGTHNIVWNTRDDQGNAVPPGVYIIRMSTEGNESSTRVTLQR